MEDNQIMLFDAEVLYVNLDPTTEEAEKYGTNISIIIRNDEYYRDDLYDELERYYKRFQIGKSGDKNIGSLPIKETEDTLEEYLTIKVTNRTQYMGLGKKMLGVGSHVDLVLSCYDYDNNYGKGTGVSAAMVNVATKGKNVTLGENLLASKKKWEKARNRSAVSDTGTDASEATSSPDPSHTHPLEENGSTKDTDQQAGTAQPAGAAKPQQDTTKKDEIDLSEIPF